MKRSWTRKYRPPARPKVTAKGQAALGNTAFGLAAAMKKLDKPCNSSNNQVDTHPMSLLDLLRIPQRLTRMSAQLDALTAQVAQNNTVIQSAITLIQGIKAALDAAIASGDPNQLTALSSQLSASDQALADAVAANTPAVTTP